MARAFCQEPNTAAMAPQSCSCRSCGKGVVELCLDQGLVAGDDLGPILGAKLRVELEAFEIFVVLEDLLEQVMVDAEHHVGIHLDEAAIGVVGEAAVGRAPRQALDGLIVEAEIEHRVHHARHRGAGARAHRHEQRIVHIAETRAGDLGRPRRAPRPPSASARRASLRPSS